MLTHMMEKNEKLAITSAKIHIFCTQNNIYKNLTATSSVNDVNKCMDTRHGQCLHCCLPNVNYLNISLCKKCTHLLSFQMQHMYPDCIRICLAMPQVFPRDSCIRHTFEALDNLQCKLAKFLHLISQ